MVYCLDIYQDAVLWNREVPSGVDRLAINPNGQLIYMPTWEGATVNYIQVLDAGTGDVVKRVYFSNRSHDTQYPLSGPIFQETKAEDGSGHYLYLINPDTYAVSRVGPYLGVLGPYAVDSLSRYVVNNVTTVWGMQVADLKTGQIITASVPDHPPGNAGLLHGIGWTPDQTEVWQSGPKHDPHVYVWDMTKPMAPVLKARLALRSGHGSHWLTFDISRRALTNRCATWLARRQRPRGVFPTGGPFRRGIPNIRHTVFADRARGPAAPNAALHCKAGNIHIAVGVAGVWHRFEQAKQVCHTRRGQLCRLHGRGSRPAAGYVSAEAGNGST
jgi:hypothetical protein